MLSPPRTKPFEDRCKSKSSTLGNSILTPVWVESSGLTSTLCQALPLFACSCSSPPIYCPELPRSDGNFISEHSPHCTLQGEGTEVQQRGNSCCSLAIWEHQEAEPGWVGVRGEFREVLGRDISAMELKSKICTAAKHLKWRSLNFEFSNLTFLLSILHKTIKMKQP